ncbi:MAG: hypothetical protein ACREOI_36980, partial [bacterium]
MAFPFRIWDCGLRRLDYLQSRNPQSTIDSLMPQRFDRIRQRGFEYGLTFSFTRGKLNHQSFKLILIWARSKVMTTLQKLEELIYKGFKETDERLAKHRQETDELFAKHRQETDELLVKHRQETDAL